MNKAYDVLIVGAGVIGCGIARELSRYKLDTAVLEKESDVGWGTTKANSGIIHAGYDATPKTLKASLSAPGNRQYEKWTDPLSVPFERVGSLVSTKEESGVKKLVKLKEQGEKNGVEGLEVVKEGERLNYLEPNLSGEVVAALHAPSAGIVSPYKLTIALFENAKANEVDFFFESPVEDVACEDISDEGFIFTVDTPEGKFKSRYLVNAAGIFSGEITRLAGDESFSIFPARGEYYLLDSEIGDHVNKVNFPLPSNESKGILVTPAAEGSIIFGPNHQPLDQPSLATTKNGLQEVLEGAQGLFPDIDTGKIITNFAGLRAKAGTNDFVIGESESVEGFINVGGIQSPGLTAAPAIADHVVCLLESLGLVLREDSEFDPYREPIRRFSDLAFDEIPEYVKNSAARKEIVCRCEEITRAEVEEAINRGASTLDGIKFRTRARMGTCQGGFCTPRLIEILADKLDISPKEVTKKGDSSYLLNEETKQVD